MEDKQTIKALVEKAYELGFEYEKIYRGCSQCTLAATRISLQFILEKGLMDLPLDAASE